MSQRYTTYPAPQTSELSSSPPTVFKNGIPVKDKKNFNKDLSGALRTKRKLANFINLIEKTGTGSQTGGTLSQSEETIISSMPKKNQKKGKATAGGRRDRDQDSGSSSGGDEIVTGEGFETSRDTSSLAFDFDSAMVVDSNDEDADSSVPHMRSFADGILYRKLSCNSILVSIEPFKKLHFAGKAMVQVLKGTVNIYGFHFGADENKYTVFSAKGHSSVVYIESTSRGGSSDTPSEALRTSGNISDDEYYSATGALVVLEGFENEWCEGVRHNHAQGTNYIGPSITGIGPGKTPPLKNFLDKLGFQFISESRADKFKLLNFPSYFDEIFTDLIEKYGCATGKICPFGGKGVGKSTFVRWLTNRFLSYSDNRKVLFLDLDPGQTEFTPPGVLSVHVCTEPILGPNFSHLQEPTRAVFLGGVNVSEFPISYIKGVAELFEFCSSQEDLLGVPWVINTMGFSRGLGVDFACEIIKIIRPNSIVQLNIDNEQRSFPFLLSRTNVAKHSTFLSEHLSPKYKEPLDEFVFLSVNSVCNRENSNVATWGANPKVSRELVLISYFAEKIGNTEDFSLLSVVPQCVPLNSIAIGSMNSNLSYDEILATLKGNLVALCEMSDCTFESVHGSDKKFIRNAGNNSNRFLGYGIVRAIHKKSDTLYLLTTLQDSEAISKVNVILGAGAVGLPVQFYVSNKGKKVSELPYVIDRNEGTSTLHTAAKKFFVPKRVVHPVLKNCLL